MVSKDISLGIMNFYERMEFLALMELARATRMHQCTVIPVEPPVLVNGPDKLSLCEQMFEQGSAFDAPPV